MNNTVKVTKIGVYHIVEDTHTDECEAVPGWDTIWNDELKRDWDMYGHWQCPHCKCVRDRDSADMISYEEYKETYL